MLDVAQMVWVDIKCRGLMQQDCSEVRAVTVNPHPYTRGYTTL